jgi:streptogramin lyase
MAIVAGPKARIVTIDPVAQTRMHLFQLTTTNNLIVYPAFNGRWIWLTRLSTSNVVPFDLETQTTGTAISVSTNPVGIWDDGRFLWTLAATGALRRIDLETGTVIESISLGADVYQGLTGDKRFLWVMDTTTTSVIQVDRETGTVVNSFTRPANAADLHHDGRFLWILTGAVGVQGTIKQYDPETGTQLGSFNITNYALTDSPAGLTGDGRFLYNTEIIQ